MSANQEHGLREALERAVVLLREWRSMAWPDDPGFVLPVDRMSRTDVFLDFQAPEALAAFSSDCVGGGGAPPEGRDVAIEAKRAWLFGDDPNARHGDMLALESAIEDALEAENIEESQGRGWREVAHILTPVLWNLGVRIVRSWPDFPAVDGPDAPPEDGLLSLAEKMLAQAKELDPEARRVLTENLWYLYVSDGAPEDVHGPYRVQEDGREWWGVYRGGDFYFHGTQENAIAVRDALNRVARGGTPLPTDEQRAEWERRRKPGNPPI